jgi:hypothetical protein
MLCNRKFFMQKFATANLINRLRPFIPSFRAKGRTDWTALPAGINLL